MGKKVEKALGKDKGQASASSHEHDDDPNKPPGMQAVAALTLPSLYSCVYIAIVLTSRKMTLSVVLEPYSCTGQFVNDFSELCRRAKMVVVPPVVPRPHRPVSPPPVIQDEPKGKAKGGDKKKQAVEVIPEPEVEPELDENGGERHILNPEHSFIHIYVCIFDCPNSLTDLG